MVRHGILVGLLALAAAVPLRAGEGASRAEVETLRRQLREQQARLDALEGLLRGTIAKDVAALRKEVDAVGARANARPFASWAEKVKFNGDFRYRHEWTDDEDKSRERARHRVRLRLGLEAHPTEDLDLYVRLVTGGDNPRGTNQTLDGAFSSKDLMLDRAYVDWHPASLQGVHLLAGKMAQPWRHPGSSQLIWDSDISPEGLAATSETPITETTRAFATVGSFWVDESSSDEDILLWACQVGVTHEIAEAAKFTLGGSYFHYHNLQGRTPLFDPTTGYGNTTQTVTKTTTLDCTAGGDPVICTEESEVYTQGYRLWEFFCVFETTAAGLPMALYGDYVNNTAATSGQDTGWLVGCTLGTAKAPGTWQLDYNYRRVENDAVIGAFTESDFHGGRTGGEGHKVTAAYQVNKAAQVALTYFLSNDEDESANNDNYRKLQVDFKVKF
ncbi:MAG: putative porin [Candidatus Brocadiae bacterium]|nr:putative porin [Candidatus Brocadiia bacterium]